MENGKKPINPILDLNQDFTGLWGLTKREYFAGLAMQSLAGIEFSESGSHSIDIIEKVVKRSVRLADELLKQLEQ